MAWELTGNSGTTSANFLGTTDAQPLSIRTNNSERVAITASGNVGVGKIPAGNYRLDVAGSINATEIYRNGAPLSGFQWWEFPGGISYASGNVVVGLMSPRSGRYRLDVAGLLNADDVYKGGVPLVGSQWTDIATGSISYGGNVGIGTTSPQFSRVMIEDGSVPLSLRETGQSPTAGGLWRMPLDAGMWRFDVNTAASGDFSSYLTPLTMYPTGDVGLGRNLNVAGNVGIGTTAPQYALHLKTGWGFLGLDTQGVNQHSGIRLHENGAVKWHIWNNGSAGGNNLSINSATNLGISVAQNGNVGFGGDIRLEAGRRFYSPGRLHVHGEELLYILNKAGVVIGKEWGGNGDLRVQGNATVGAGGNGVLKLRHIDGKHWLNDNNDALHLNWNTGFPVIIGNSGVKADLHVAGNAFKPGGGFWSASSDIRLKKSVQSLKGALEKLSRLRGVSFQWREPEKQGDLTGPQMGLIAQEVEEVLPEWVDTDASGYKNLTVRGFEALVVEAFKELKADNEAVKAENEAVKTKLTASNNEVRAAMDELRARIEALDPALQTPQSSTLS